VRERSTVMRPVRPPTYRVPLHEIQATTAGPGETVTLLQDLLLLVSTNTSS